MYCVTVRKQEDIFPRPWSTFILGVVQETVGLLGAVSRVGIDESQGLKQQQTLAQHMRKCLLTGRTACGWREPSDIHCNGNYARFFFMVQALGCGW